MATDQKCRLRRGGCTGGGGGGWPAGMRGGATAGPVGDLRKRFSPPWLSSVDNRSSLQADPFEDRPEALYEFVAEDMAAMRLSEPTAASRLS